LTDFLRKLYSREEGQDIAEYAVMLAVILVLVVGTLRLIGASANNVFSAALISSVMMVRWSSARGLLHVKVTRRWRCPTREYDAVL